MTREDTRTEFLRTIATRVPHGARIAVEGYGPPLRFAPESLTLLSGPAQWTSRAEQREAALLTPLTPDRPSYVVVPLERFPVFVRDGAIIPLDVTSDASGHFSGQNIQDVAVAKAAAQRTGLRHGSESL